MLPKARPGGGSSVGRELSPRSPRTGSGPFLLLGTPNRGESRRGRGTRQTGHLPTLSGDAVLWRCQGPGGAGRPPPRFVEAAPRGTSGVALRGRDEGRGAGTHRSGRRQRRRAAAGAQPRGAAPWLRPAVGRGEAGEKASEERVWGERGRESAACAAGSDVSRPTGSAGDGRAAPSWLRLHLRGAEGGSGTSSPGSRALLNRPLPPHLGETGWSRASPSSAPSLSLPRPKYSPFRGGRGERPEVRPGGRERG